MYTNIIASHHGKKSNVNKVYVPATNRENHYLLIELPVSAALIELVSQSSSVSEEGLAEFYMRVNQSFILISKRNGIKSGLFVANDKLVRLRYGEESQVIETKEQLIVFYDPQSHTGFQTYYDLNKRAKKICMVVLASGDDIRQTAYKLHQSALQMAVELAEVLGFSSHLLKIKDHQHITYDLFSAEKGIKKSHTHEFRKVTKRYQQQGLLIPRLNSQINYVVAELPITEALAEVTNKLALHLSPYSELYIHISNVVAEVTQSLEVKNAVMIANGRHPIVICAKHGFVHNEGELVYLGFNPNESQNCIAKWNSATLTNKFTLVFAASDLDINQDSYGRFVNRIHSVLRKVMVKLNIDVEIHQLIVRFHQHIAYQLPKGDAR